MMRTSPAESAAGAAQDRSKSSERTAASTIAAVLLAATVAGCGTDPETRTAEPPGPEASRTRLPQRVTESAATPTVVAANLVEHLRKLTGFDRTAGSPASDAARRYVASQLRSWGYDVSVHSYHVLVPRPRRVAVEMIRPVAWAARLRETPTDKDPQSALPGPLPMALFSPDADVTAPLYYVNSGTPHDLQILAQQGIDLRGAVVLARFGRSHPAAIARAVAAVGAAALLLYSDPADDGFARGDVYPDGRFRPLSGIRRTSILDVFAYAGDPGTPGRPSLPEAHGEQLTYDAMRSLPQVPCVTLSAADVEPLLRQLSGPGVPDGWQGALPFAYHVGAGRVAVRVVLEIDERLRPIHDVVATWTGLEQPSAFVLIGARRDAWARDAVGSASGTAVLLEAARAWSERAGRKPSPRRSVRFASWDASLLGAVGATEWAEQFLTDSAESCRAYIDLDAAVSGPDIVCEATPTLAPVARRGLAQVGVQGSKIGETAVVACAGGGDAAPFVQRFGVPTLRVRSQGDIGVLGSTFDTYAFLERQVDADGTLHRNLARLLVTLLSDVVDAPLTEVDVAELGEFVERGCKKLQGRDAQLDLKLLVARAREVTELGERWSRARAAVTTAPATWRAAADARLIAASRSLIASSPPPAEGAWQRNLVLGPDPRGSLRPVALPRLQEAVQARDRERIQREAALLLRGLETMIQRLTPLVADCEARAGTVTEPR